MAILNSIDSNSTGLRYAIEDSYKTLPGSPTWVGLEPNAYNDFGGNVTTLARDPIAEGRQQAKGVTTDLDASGGFNVDFTQSNLQEILQGYFYAAFRSKDEFGGSGEITNVDGTADEYDAASGLDDFTVGDLIYVTGFDDAANNGLKRVSSASATALGVDEDIVDDASPASAAKIVTVGVEGAVGDIDVDASGSLPTLTSTALDFTTLDLNPGEWIFVGGDVAGDQFTTAANNGWKRIRTIAANVLTLDKSDTTMVTEANTTSTVRLFFGRVLKNESDTTLISRTTYNVERALGAPDDASPNDIQGEYLTGAVPNELALNVPTAGKVTADLSFVAGDHETVSASTGLKSGTRPALTSEDAFNTSSDFSRINMAVVSDTDEDPSALFAYVTEMTININNNVSPNKAIGTLGAFEMATGIFGVSGNLTAYFSEESAIAAVRNNSNVTLDFVIVKANAGIAIDFPLMALGDGRLNVAKDQPINLPLSMNMASGDQVHSGLDHTAMMVFFDYLPTAADV